MTNHRTIQPDARKIDIRGSSASGCSSANSTLGLNLTMPFPRPTHRFCLSFRDVEDLLAQRGITVSYETIRHWCQTFGLDYARMLRRRRGRLGDTWYLDEIFVTMHGRRQYLWRAVDQDGDLLDILVQSRRDRRAAVRFFRKVLKVKADRQAVLSRTSCAVTRQPTVPSCGPWCTALGSTRTTEQRSRINRRGNASDRCAGSNPRRTRSGFSRYTDSC